MPNKLDAGKVTMATGVTQAGFAADARQMNPAWAGSLASEVVKVRNSQNDLKTKFSETLVEGCINTDILRYAENVAGKGLTYAYTSSMEITKVPQYYYAYANTLILKSGIGGRINVIIFDRATSGRFVMNTKYNELNWSGWKEISAL